MINGAGRSGAERGGAERSGTERGGAERGGAGRSVPEMDVDFVGVPRVRQVAVGDHERAKVQVLVELDKVDVDVPPGPQRGDREECADPRAAARHQPEDPHGVHHSALWFGPTYVPSAVSRTRHSGPYTRTAKRGVRRQCQRRATIRPPTRLF